MYARNQKNEDRYSPLLAGACLKTDGFDDAVPPQAEARLSVLTTFVDMSL